MIGWSLVHSPCQTENGKQFDSKTINFSLSLSNMAEPIFLSPGSPDNPLVLPLKAVREGHFSIFDMNLKKISNVPASSGLISHNSSLGVDSWERLPISKAFRSASCLPVKWYRKFPNQNATEELHGWEVFIISGITKFHRWTMSLLAHYLEHVHGLAHSVHLTVHEFFTGHWHHHILICKIKTKYGNINI